MSGHDSFRPWLTMWTKPRATIAKLVAGGNLNRGVWWLAAIYGFSGLLNFFQSMFLGMRLGTGPIFLLALILCSLWGYASFSVWSFIICFTGKCFKGVASFKMLRLAYAWSAVPFIVNDVLWLLMVAVFGQLLFMNFTEGYAFTQGEVAFLFVVLAARITVGIWSLVLYLNALAEVQRFSILRAIGNVVLAALVLGAFFWVLSFLFFMHV